MSGADVSFFQGRNVDGEVPSEETDHSH
jgi:hypothetical protein